MERIYIWKNGNQYYHKVGKGCYLYNKVGDINQYDHVLVHIVELSDFFDFNKNKVSYRKMLINDTIRFLEKIR